MEDVVDVVHFSDLHISRSKCKILYRCEAYLSTSRDSHAFETRIE